MGKAEDRIRTIFSKYEHSDISVSELSKLDILPKIGKTRKLPLKWIICVLTVVSLYVVVKNVNIFDDSKVILNLFSYFF